MAQIAFVELTEPPPDGSNNSASAASRIDAQRADQQADKSAFQTMTSKVFQERRHNRTPLPYKLSQAIVPPL